MAGFRINAFTGAVPGRAPRLLENQQGQIARNARFRDGDLVPYGAATKQTDLPKAGTMDTLYQYSPASTDYWFHWTEDVDVVEGPVPNDDSGRVYWTGESEPRMTYASIATQGNSGEYPTNWFILGVPAPNNAPSASVSGSANDPDDPGSDRSYVYTYVTDKGEEGPPSDPSGIVTWKPGQTVDLSNMSTGPSGNYNVQTKRIYRTQTGSDGTVDFRFVDEIGVANNTYSDNILPTKLGEILPSTDWQNPPSDMVGLTPMANGILAGFRQNEILFSVPFTPHAWPVSFRLSTDSDIVAIASFGNSLAVATKEFPYIVTGSDPRAMSMQDAGVANACVAKRSMVDLGGGVHFASPEGLVRVSSDGIGLVTQNLFTEEQWQAYKPSSFDAYLFDGHYLAFYDDGNNTGALMVAPDGSQAIDLDLYATAAWRDPVDGALYVVQNGNEVWRYNDGSALTAHWRSKVFVTPTPTNMAVGRVEAESYPVTLKLYADGSQQASVSVADGDPFPLPGGYLARRWSVEVESNARVREIAVGESIADIAQ